MKNFIKSILEKISRVIYELIPREFKNRDNEYDMYSKIIEHSKNETFEHFKDDYKRSVLFTNKWKIREYAIKTALLNDKNKENYYLEFGVFKGKTSNFFSKFIHKLYCFDSFEGLKEDWVGTKIPKGHFNLNKKIPVLKSNVEPIIGWVEDTLDVFLEKNNPKINFVHFDMDTYSSTKFTLKKIKPYLTKNAILIFDEFTGYIGWENGEYKAFKEVFKEEEFTYLAFSMRDGYDKCVVQIK